MSASGQGQPSRSFLELEALSRVPAGRRARWLLLVLGCAAIVAWQSALFKDRHRLDGAYRVWASSGLHPWTPALGFHPGKFLYFYYYLGLYPVATEREDVEYSQAGARRILEEHGESLVMEWGHAIRYGDLGKVFLYLPDALLKGAPRNPSVRPCHAMAFTAALVALFVAFWAVRQPVLGVLAVVLLGSNPFQLFETYANENLFGWPITIALLVLALHLPLLMGAKVRRGYLWAVPVATGVLLATIKQVRSEPTAIVLAAGASYLVLARARWATRLGLLAVLGASYALVGRGWQAYFDHKFAQAYRVVKAAGGHPYDGPRASHHMFWHPVWCGLGDFDTTHGYAWNDRAAADYALPILQQKYGVAVPQGGRSHVAFQAHWDEAGKYYKTPYELPHYNEVLRDKVLHDITHDPLWYLGILARRAWRVLSETTPPQLKAGRLDLRIPMHGVLLLPVSLLLAVRRAWMPLKLLWFTMPLALPALAIYSGRGMCYYSCYHLFLTALLGAWALEALARRGRKPPRGAAAATKPPGKG